MLECSLIINYWEDDQDRHFQVAYYEGESYIVEEKEDISDVFRWLDTDEREPLLTKIVLVDNEGEEVEFMPGDEEID